MSKDADRSSAFDVEFVGPEPSEEYHARSLQDGAAESQVPKKRGRPPKVKKEEVQPEPEVKSEPKSKKGKGKAKVSDPLPPPPVEPEPEPEPEIDVCPDEVVLTVEDCPEEEVVDTEYKNRYIVDDVPTAVGVMQLKELNALRKQVDLLNRGQGLSVTLQATSVILLSGIVFLLMIK